MRKASIGSVDAKIRRIASATSSMSNRADCSFFLLAKNTQLICPWHGQTHASAFLEYDGNKGTLMPSKSFAFIADRACTHFHAQEAGDPLFDIRQEQLGVQKST
jgi:hypothetical protein